MKDIAIDAQGLTKSFGPRTVVRNLTLKVPKGEIYGFLGPNGSGKTTTLRMLCGLLTPDSGKGTCLGYDILTEQDAIKRHVGYMTQQDSVLPWRTVFENVELPLLLTRLGRRERKRRVEVALDIVGLSDRMHHLPKQMSGGQEQRVAIARALVTDPSLVVADEPTGNLDSHSAQEVLTTLQRLSREAGKTVIMVTHDPKAAAYGSRSIHLEKGELIRDEVETLKG